MRIWDKGVSGSPQKRQLGREDPLAADVGRWAESHLSTMRRGLPTPPLGSGAEQAHASAGEHGPTHSPAQGCVPPGRGADHPQQGHGPRCFCYNLHRSTLQLWSSVRPHSETCAAFSYAQNGLTTNGLNNHRSQSTPPHNNTRHFSLTHAGKTDVVLVDVCYFSEGKLING